MRRRAIAAMLVSAACGVSGGLAGGPDAAPPDAHAINDCWDTLACEGGQVYQTYGSDSSTDPTCGRAVATTCAQGCDSERSFFDETDGIDPQALCVGYPDKQPGDACPCWPTHAPDYLTCDAQSNTCVAASAPTVAHWLELCTPDVAPTGDFHGVTAGGVLGMCLVDQYATGCTMTAASLHCNGDWDCPINATCDSSLPSMLTFAEGVCRPGARGTPLTLGCTP